MSAVPLGDDLGIEAATDLKQQLSAHLAQSDLMLDAAAVKRVHTASMQVLCTFVRERQQAGRKTGFTAISPALSDAARLLGVAAQLGFPPNDKDSNKQAVENAA